MKTFAEITVDYDKTLAAAKPLGFWAHWLAGIVFVVIGALIENPQAVVEDPGNLLIGAIAFGLIAGIISKIIVMPLIPAPYAWLAKRLGLSPAV